MKFPSYLLLWIAFSMSSGKLMSAELSDLSYSVKYGSVIITDCKTTATGELEIPASIEEIPVSKIGSAAFRGCSNLTSITIPDGVTTIGDESF